MMKKLFCLLVFAFILFGFQNIALAKKIPLAQQRNYQPLGTTGVYSVFGAKTLKKGQIAIGLAADFAPDAFYDDDTHPDQKTMALQFGYGITEKLDIGLDLPFTWWYPDVVPPDKIGWHEQGFDDLSIGLRYRILDENESLPGIAILGAVTLPTGDEDKGLSTGGTDFEPKLIMSKRLGPVNTHLNIGYYWPGEKKYNLQDGLTYGIGMDFSVSSQTQLLAELVGNKNRYTKDIHPKGDTDPLEVRAGVRIISDVGLITTLGVGFGLSNASPDYRALAVLTYTYPPEAKKVIKVKEPEVPPKPSAEELYKIILEDVHFEFDKSTLTSTARSILDMNGKKLKENPGIKVIIEGHCDERGSNEYNLALGERRAVSVRNYLSSLGIENKRMKTVSYGEERPLDPGHNERAWALNRRAHFVIEID